MVESGDNATLFFSRRAAWRSLLAAADARARKLSLPLLPPCQRSGISGSGGETQPAAQSVSFVDHHTKCTIYRDAEDRTRKQFPQFSRFASPSGTFETSHSCKTLRLVGSCSLGSSGRGLGHFSEIDNRGNPN